MVRDKEEGTAQRGVSIIGSAGPGIGVWEKEESRWEGLEGGGVVSDMVHQRRWEGLEGWRGRL